MPVWGQIDLGGALIQYHTDVYSKNRVIDSGESENLLANFKKWLIGSEILECFNIFLCVRFSRENSNYAGSFTQTSFCIVYFDDSSFSLVDLSTY